MNKCGALALLLVSIGCISPAQSQGLMEGTFVRGLGAGMGAGLAGSMGKGKVVRRTYESMVQAQQAMIAQTKVIEQNIATGVQMEAKKQWVSAEQYFQDALKMIAKRDGPGSQKSAPVLAHLAKISKSQNKLDEAIGYQKTVVAFANVVKTQNPAAAVQAQTDLGSMYIDKGDFNNAEGVLKQSADIVRHDRSVSPKSYSTTLRVYGEVLRKLNKDAEADSIDAELASQAEAHSTAATATTTPVQTTPAVSTAPSAVPAESTSTSASAPVSTNASTAVSTSTGASSTTMPDSTSASAPTSAPVVEDAKNSTTAAQPESAPVVSTSPSTTAAPPDAATPSTNPPGALLPPPTADWPVMNSDGKIDAQPSAPQADTPPAANPGGETPVSPATQPISEPAKNAPAAPAGIENTESK